MIKKSTWVSLILFIILASAAFFLQDLDLSKENSITVPTLYPGLFSNNDTSEIIQIEIFASGKEIFILNKGDDQKWVFSDLAEVKVDQGKVQELFSYIFSAEVISGTDNKLTDLAIFGLDKPSVVITLHNITNISKTLAIGTKTPTDSGYYVQVNNDPPVVIRSQTAEEVINLSERSNLINQKENNILTPQPY